MGNAMVDTHKRDIERKGKGTGGSRNCAQAWPETRPLRERYTCHLFWFGKHRADELFHYGRVVLGGLAGVNTSLRRAIGS